MAAAPTPNNPTPVQHQIQQTRKLLLEHYGLTLSVPNAGQRYDLYDEIGRGGLATVYLAVDRDLKRQVAVKVLQPRWRERPEVVAQFLHEAKITARLQHPNVPHVYDVGFLPGGEIFMAMEKVEGATLRELLDREVAGDRPRPRRERLLRTFLQVCQTVAYAHSAGIIHRDLKPENIMIGEFNRVYVMDWGLARDLEDAGPVLGEGGAGAPNLKGTPRYMSPEQVLGLHQKVDARGDVFSLGILLYEILAGCHPFARDDVRLTLHAIANEPAPRLKSTIGSGDWVDICGKALAKLPNDRYANAGALAEDLEAALEFRPISLKNDQLSQHLIKYSLRNWFFLVLVLGLVGAGGWVWLKQRHQQEQRHYALTLARTRIEAGHRFSELAAALRRRLNAAPPAQREGLTAELATAQAGMWAEHLAARQTLLLLLRQESQLPPWATSELKRLWFADLQLSLDLAERERARQILLELSAHLRADDARLQWSATEWREVSNLRDLLLGPQP